MNTLKKYQRIRPQNKIEDTIEMLQDRVEEVIAEFTDRDQNDTLLIENVELFGGYETIIRHQLGRTPVGFFVTKSSELNIVPSFVEATDIYLKVGSAADAIVNLVVY